MQTGVIPVAGTRELTAEALASATIHNPWYLTGPSRQTRGRTVVIPDHFVTDSRRLFTGYYACDHRTGDYAAVMEDGLCGSSDGFDQALADRQQVLKAIKPMIESPAPVMAGGAFNAFRGAR